MLRLLKAGLLASAVVGFATLPITADAAQPMAKKAAMPAKGAPMKGGAMKGAMKGGAMKGGAMKGGAAKGSGKAGGDPLNAAAGKKM